MIFSLAKLILLLGLPIVTFLIVRRKITNHTYCITFAVFGIAVVPFSFILTLHFGLLPSLFQVITLPINWVSMLFGYSYQELLIPNIIVWGTLSVLCGYVFDIFLDTGKSKDKKLWDAVINGELFQVRKLLHDKADPNCSIEGIPPLVEAAGNGDTDIVHELLNFKADVNIKANQSVTPIIMAAQQGHIDIANILIQNNAEINSARDDNGATALMMAVQQGHSDLVSLLLKNGADINQSAADGQTALYLAAEYGNIDIVNTLLKSGANVNIACHERESSIYVAAHKGYLEIVKALIDAGADLTLRFKGATLLYAACRSGHEEIARLLLEKGSVGRQRSP